MSNIAEGLERKGDAEFRRFLSFAKGSAGEVRSRLYVALDAGMLREDEFSGISRLATEICRLVGGFMRYLTISMKAE